MIDIVKKFNYSYVSVVNTNENYGQSGLQAFRELAAENSVCIAKEGILRIAIPKLDFKFKLPNARRFNFE